MAYSFNSITFSPVRSGSSWFGPSDLRITAAATVQTYMPVDATAAERELRGNTHGEVTFSATFRASSGAVAAALCVSHALGMTGASSTLVIGTSSFTAICETCTCYHRGCTVFASYKLLF